MSSCLLPEAALAQGRWVKLICGASNQDLDAIEDLCQAFSDGLLPNSLDDTLYFNVRRMKELNVR